MRDFSLTIFRLLLNTLKDYGYRFYGVDLAPEPDGGKFIILRHDVDRSPQNALRMASMETGLGIRSSYYFRAVPQSFHESVIRKISRMNHEVGYHYENFSAVADRQDFKKFQIQNSKSQTNSNNPNSNDQNKSEMQTQKTNQKSIKDQNIQNAKDRIMNDPEMKPLFELAIDDFEKNLKRFRKITSVKSICMHGSPLSKVDNRVLWKVYDYRDFGIEREPYIDFDFSKVFYLTDTGRRWDGDRFSVRDRVEEKGVQWPVYHSTRDIITAVAEGCFPPQVMITVHPQRWTNQPIPWLKELIWQNFKNVIKRYYVK